MKQCENSLCNLTKLISVSFVLVKLKLTKLEDL